MKCPACRVDLVWQNDFDYEDFGMVGKEGVVGVYVCANDKCSVDLVEIYME